MRPSLWLYLAAVSLLAGGAAARPRYGGTLRVQTGAALDAFDPGETGEGAAQLLPLAFDTLVRIGPDGRIEPSLAVSWTHDGESRRWEFRLRPGVRFQDGSPLAASAAVATALASVLRETTVEGTGDTLTVRCARPAPELPYELAQRGYIFIRHAEGTPVGTGPFRPVRWEARRRAAFTANDDYWNGRPFLDAVEVEMGRSAREQLMALDVGRADIAELAPAEVRRAAERGRKVWQSSPVRVLALVFREKRAEDARVRTALALAIDRAAIHNVLLGKQGEISGALLPNWLSGDAFLFPGAADLEQARKLAAEAPEAARSLTLACDAQDRTIADRIALNAKDAGLTVTVTAAARGPAPDLRLTTLRADSLDAGKALAGLAAALGRNIEPATSPEALYAAERGLLEGGRIVPLFHLPVTFGAAARVRVWTDAAVLPLGGWRFENVWLGTARP